MLVTLWGARGSVPAPGVGTVRYGGNTSCLEIKLEDGTELILDAGTGIRRLGKKLVAEGEPRPLFVLMSHAHWDHVHGFPFFRPAYEPDWTLHVAGSSRSIKAIKDLLYTQMNGLNFPVEFGELKAEIDFMALGDTAASIRSARLELGTCAHPGGCTSFRIVEGGGTLVHMTDNELSAPATDAKARRAELVALCRDADVLIHDAQFLPEELARHAGWGHSTYLEAVELAAEAGVRRLVLFHHDPDRTDDQIEEIERLAREHIARQAYPLQCEAAREGLELCI